MTQKCAKTTPKRHQHATKTPPKRHQNATTPHMFIVFLWGKRTIRARGESNRLPPGSDPPTSRGPNHYANPAPEPRFLSGFLCTGNTGPGRAVRVNCRPSRKRRLEKTSTLDILKRICFVVFRGKTHSAGAFLNLKNSIPEQ